jgi:Fic family protein
MADLYPPPGLDLEDRQVIDEINATRMALASVLRAPKRWSGGLRRTAQARAIQGSNTIEGYTVTDQDAAAAVEDEPPLSADERTWAEILGYRRVLTYVLHVATEPGFVIDDTVLRSMHFMLLEHDLTKGPGTYRRGPAYVHDERRGEAVYEGAPADDLPALMRALAAELAERDDEPIVRAAMAHLNLVLIHPFRDGNGRMARALQTMVLAGDQVIEPTFSSIEEWLGQHTQDYYDVLAVTGQGAWRRGDDTHLWLKFNLRAHHQQAQTQQRRFSEAEQLWTRIDDLRGQHALPDRMGDALFDALLGQRITRATYVKRTGLEERTATRDLGRLADLGLLETHGQTRARHYTASERLRQLRDELRALRSPLTDPFPTLQGEIHREM